MATTTTADKQAARDLQVLDLMGRTLDFTIYSEDEFWVHVAGKRGIEERRYTLTKDGAKHVNEVFRRIHMMVRTPEGRQQSGIITERIGRREYVWARWETVGHLDLIFVDQDDLKVESKDLATFYDVEILD